MAANCKTCGSKLDLRGDCLLCVDSSGPTVVPAADDSSEPTFAGLPAEQPRLQSSAHSPHTSASPSSSSGARDAYFLVPGTVLANRYRIVAPIGKGGMGQVYRADDLKLGETVALKFLPEALAADPAWLGRFFLEVRTAREVTHPNVCRVHDVVESEDPNGTPLTFLTMEFVDGETLADIVRRFGRLPTDKAMGLGAEICSALAAAHARGVLHRDIKPANILVDGRGHAKLADFGLAVGRGAQGEAEIAGTPGYIAPELLRGAPATGRSDLYALGLVLYELLTGRRAVKDGKSQVSAEDGAIRKYAPEVPEAVERVVLACVQAAPELRPVSAAEVAAKFPEQQNELDAALARGETPSPEMVADAADDAPLSLRRGWALACAVAATVLLIWIFAGWGNFLNVLPPDVSPDESAVHSRDLLRALGYDENGTLAAMYVGGNFTMLDWYANNGTRAQKRNFAAAPQGSLLYRYEQTKDGDVLPQFDDDTGEYSGAKDGPQRQGVVMDSRGNLIELTADPASVAPPSVSAAETDWSKLIAATGLDAASLKPAAADFDVPFEFSERRAWTGSYPGAPEFLFRVSAASWKGRPSYLRVEPVTWRAPVEGVVSYRNAVNATLALLWMLVGLALATWNLRRRRGDLRNATRLGVMMFVAYAAGYLGYVGYQTRSAMAQVRSANQVLAFALFNAATVWLAYVAVEPLARRHFPRMLQGSTLLLQNKWRNPRVGRELLIGAWAGAGIALSYAVIHAIAWRLPGKATLSVTEYDITSAGLRTHIFGCMSHVVGDGIWTAVTMAMQLTAALLLVRKRWLAALVPLVIMMNIGDARGNLLYSLIIGFCFAAPLVWLLVRYGVLVCGAAFVFSEWLDLSAWPHSPESWMMPNMLVTVTVAMAATALFFWLAIGRRSPFGNMTLEP